MEQAPPRPEPWTSEVRGFYYVDAQRGSDARTYGTPDAPRQTIPSTLPAGSVVELHGTYSYAPQGYQEIRPAGTREQPVFIRGQDAESRPSWTRALYIKGSYCILENIVFKDHDGTLQGSVWFLAPSSYCVLRHCDVSGNKNKGGGVRAVSWDESTVHNIVLWKNVIHDNGDWSNPNGDQDVHGIVVSADAHHIWILDNELFHNSGDGLQINAGNVKKLPTTHHIYVGRNISHHNKQTGLWTKQATDVIFSQNTSYGHRPSESSNGAGMGFQYDPQRVWFLYNHIHDCAYGISTTSGSGLGDGTEAYFVGNLIHDIHHDPERPYNPGSAWSNAALMLVGSVDNYVVNNTIVNVDAGINTPNGNLRLHMYNNIISNVTDARGNHVFIEYPGATRPSQLAQTLLWQNERPVRIRWASRVRDLLAFQSITGKGRGCIKADPQFVNPATGDFRLQTGSPAVDAGTAHQVYDRFERLYELDIRVDVAGTARPQGKGWDMGAYEQTTHQVISDK